MGNIDFLKLELDGLTTIGIVDGSFFYEYESYTGELEEVEIPLKNIHKISFIDRQVNLERTWGNIIEGLIYTMFNNSPNSVGVEHEHPCLLVHFYNEHSDQNEVFKISSRNLNHKIYQEIEVRLKI